jgi:hypothetical protein
MKYLKNILIYGGLSLIALVHLLLFFVDMTEQMYFTHNVVMIVLAIVVLIGVKLRR